MSWRYILPLEEWNIYPCYQSASKSIIPRPKVQALYLLISHKVVFLKMSLIYISFALSYIIDIREFYFHTTLTILIIQAKINC